MNFILISYLRSIESRLLCLWNTKSPPMGISSGTSVTTNPPKTAHLRKRNPFTKRVNASARNPKKKKRLPTTKDHSEYLNRSRSTKASKIIPISIGRFAIDVSCVHTSPCYDVYTRAIQTRHACGIISRITRLNMTRRWWWANKWRPKTILASASRMGKKDRGKL